MNRHFTAFSGMAIAVVVLHHTILMGMRAAQEMGYALPVGWENYLLQALLQLGIFAVPTFMFISGAFFAYTAQGTNPKLSYRTVWVGLQRLLWPYLVWSVVFYIVLFLVEGKTFSFFGYLKNLLVGYPYNFVPLLVFYYLLSPILVRLSKKFGWVILVAIAIYQLFLKILLNPDTFGLAFPGWMNYLAPLVIRSTLADWGIFFPLGVIYNLKSKTVTPQLVKYGMIFAGLTVVFFGVSVLNWMGMINFPLANFLAATMLILCLPSIQRSSIPLFCQLEKLGRKSYGLYLTDFIVLSLILVVVKDFIPGVLHYQILFVPILYALTLTFQLGMMGLLELHPVRFVYRYVYG